HGTWSAEFETILTFDFRVFLVFRSEFRAPHSALQNVVDQRTLAGTAHAGHAVEHAQWDVHGQVLEVVLSGPDDAETAIPVDGSPSLRNGNSLGTREVSSGEAVRCGEDLGRRTGSDDVAATDSGA